MPHREVGDVFEMWMGFVGFCSPDIHREIHWEYCEVFTSRPGQRLHHELENHHAMNG